MRGDYFFWLGASAEPTGLGTAKAAEPVKPSPSFGCHPSREPLRNLVGYEIKPDYGWLSRIGVEL